MDRDGEKVCYLPFPILQNVMYLMIVNMPSEEELATAKREMEQEKKQKKGEAPSELVQR